MRTGLIFLSAILMISTWAGYAFAGEEGHICFRRIDADQDGKVTFEEFAVYFNNDHEKFKAADTNSDKRLTHDEYHDLLGHGKTEKPEN